jgi:class 3 adenylate cyclase
MVKRIYEMFLDIDVRSVLPAIRVPTLVLHRRGDRVVNWRAGRWLADQIQDARYVELAGIDHMPWVGDADAVLDEVEDFLTGARATRAIDRVLATVLFTDIVGSTEQAVSRGDRGWRDLLAEHDRLVRDAVQRFRGRTVKGLGDGVLATFDGPARAIRCAQAICAEAHALGIEVRAGLHTGECEVMGEDLGGIAVHIGARVVEQAGPGEVLVSRTVTELVAGSGIQFKERGAYSLKGLPGEWALFAVGPKETI